MFDLFPFVYHRDQVGASGTGGACFRCGQHGHFKRLCPQGKGGGFVGGAGRGGFGGGFGDGAGHVGRFEVGAGRGFGGAGRGYRGGYGGRFGEYGRGRGRWSQDLTALNLFGRDEDEVEGAIAAAQTPQAPIQKKSRSQGGGGGGGKGPGGDGYGNRREDRRPTGRGNRPPMRTVDYSEDFRWEEDDLDKTIRGGLYPCGVIAKEVSSRARIPRTLAHQSAKVQKGPCPQGAGVKRDPRVFGLPGEATTGGPRLSSDS